MIKNKETITTELSTILSNANSPVEQNTARVLMDWWNKGDPQGTLNFSQPQVDVNTLPRLAISRVQEYITRLRLPQNLTQATLPDWLQELKALKLLAIPEYGEANIDLRQLRPNDFYRLEINGDAIRAAHVSKANVYCREVGKDHQVRVHHYDGTQSHARFEESAMGHLYYAQLEGRVNRDDFNQSLVPPMGGRGACGPAAVWEAARRQQDIVDDVTESHRAVRRSGETSTHEQLQAAAVTPNNQRIYDELIRKSPLHYIVGNTQFGNFLVDQLSAMDSEGMDEKQFLLESPNHVMSVYLRTKETPDGRKRYVITLYDPNSTLTHLRVVDNLDELRALTMANFLTEERINQYFGEQIKTSFITPIPNNLRTVINTDTPLFNVDASTGTPRVINDMYVSPAEENDHGQVYYPLCANLPLSVDAIRGRINTLKNTEEYENASELLHWTPAGRVAAFPVAMHFGNLVALRTYRELLGVLANDKTGEFPGSDVFNSLLTSVVDGLEYGQTEAVREYGEMILDLRRRGVLNEDHFVSRLGDAIVENGMPIHGILLAQRVGHLETAREHGRTILRAYENNLISSEQLKVLNPTPNWLEANLAGEFVDCLSNIIQRKINQATSQLPATSQPSTSQSTQGPSDTLRSVLDNVQQCAAANHTLETQCTLHAPLVTINMLLDSYNSLAAEGNRQPECARLLAMMTEEVQETLEDLRQTLGESQNPVRLAHPNWEPSDGVAPGNPPPGGLKGFLKGASKFIRNEPRNWVRGATPFLPSDHVIIRDALNLGGLRRDFAFEEAGNYKTLKGRPVYAADNGDLFVARMPLGPNNSRIKIVRIPYARHQLTPEQAKIYVNKANRAERAIARATRTGAEIPDNVAEHLNITFHTNTKSKEQSKHR